MASMGLLAELLDAPALWYCQQCKQCSSACPMDVSPAALIGLGRREALARQPVASQFLDAYETLCAQLLT